MIKLFFGLPGCGKTTIYTMFAKTVSDQINKDIVKSRRKKKYKPKCQYNMVYGNVHLSGINNYTYIDFEWLGKYDMRGGLILIDEASIECDSRDFKVFPKYTKDYLMVHRHYQNDLVFFTQYYDRVDKTIRNLAQETYYVYKGSLSGKLFTRYYKIPYGVDIPSRKSLEDKQYGEIVMGFCQPSFFSRLMSPWLFRPKYYKFFDSWEAPELPPLPRSAERKAE